MDGIFSAHHISESRTVYIFLAATDWNSQGIGRSGGQLLNVPETLCRTQRTFGAINAVSPQQRIV
eukprot:12898532-Prorocentrum_lima.AAC.1